MLEYPIELLFYNNMKFVLGVLHLRTTFLFVRPFLNFTIIHYLYKWNFNWEITCHERPPYVRRKGDLPKQISWYLQFGFWKKKDTLCLYSQENMSLELLCWLVTEILGRQTLKWKVDQLKCV